MRPQQREQQILAQLHALQSELSVGELAKKFTVSALTIRRDLERLERDKAILRTHGGCILKTSVESAYQKKVALNFELKQAIGRLRALVNEWHNSQTARRPPALTHGTRRLTRVFSVSF